MKEKKWSATCKGWKHKTKNKKRSHAKSGAGHLPEVVHALVCYQFKAVGVLAVARGRRPPDSNHRSQKNFAFGKSRAGRGEENAAAPQAARPHQETRV